MLDYVNKNSPSSKSFLYLKSSGDNRVKTTHIIRSVARYGIISSYDFIKSFSEDQKRIITVMEDDTPLPDIHTLNGYVQYGDARVEDSKIILEFAVDNTWNCSEMTAKDLFAKKELTAQAANNNAAPNAAAQQIPSYDEIIAQGMAQQKEALAQAEAHQKAVEAQIEANKRNTQIVSIVYQLSQHALNEIDREEGKKVGQFFSIKSALKPCQKDPDSCENMIEDLVAESFVKYTKAVVAGTLLLNEDNYDKQMATSVIIEINKKFDTFDKMKEISAKSPVGREIMKADNLSDELKTQIFYIWYLRQYPYAGENIWKNQDNPKHTWDEYMKIAEGHLAEVLNLEDGSNNNNAAANNNNVVAENNAVANNNNAVAENNNNNQAKKCHLSTWQMEKIDTGSFKESTYKLQNVSWQREPITLVTPYATPGCGSFKHTLDSIQTRLELGESNFANFSIASKSLLDCAKASNNAELREVAKECNGKWF